MRLRLHHLFFITFLLLMVFYQASIFLQDPTIWSDEALYANLAINFIKEHRLGLDLWTNNLLPGVQDFAAWNPPLFFYLLAGWFKMTSVSIVNQRLLSVLAGSITILIFYYLLTKTLPQKQKNWAWGGISFLIYDYIFLRMIKISRPEVFMLTLALLSIYSFWMGIYQKQNYKSATYLITGLLLGLSFLIHPIALMFATAIGLFLIYKQRWMVFTQKENWFLGLGWIIPTIAWLTTSWSHLDIIRQQLTIASQRKAGDPNWLFSIFSVPPISIAFEYLALILLTLVFLITYWGWWRRRDYLQSKQKDLAQLLTFLMASSWFFCVMGKMIWYYALPLIFIYWAVMILIMTTLNLWSQRQTLAESEFNKLKTLTVFLIIGVGTILLANTYTHAYVLNHYQAGNYSYSNYSQQVLAAIPANQSILLSTQPSLYYAFVDQPYETFLFPVFKVSEATYFEFLNQVDYVVYNGIHDRAMGNYLNRYLNVNTDSSQFIGSQGQYQAYIIKLKPVAQRTNP